MPERKNLSSEDFSWILFLWEPVSLHRGASVRQVHWEAVFLATGKPAGWTHLYVAWPLPCTTTPCVLMTQAPQTRTLTNQLDRIFFQKFLGGKHTLFLMYTNINVIKKCYILRQNLFVLMVHCCVKYCLCVAMSRIAEFS